MNVIELLVQQEGFRQFVYDDATGKSLKRGDTIAGHPTIGYGLCVEEGVGEGLSQPAAQSLLCNRIDAVKSELANHHGWYGSLGAARQAALVSAAFNLGLAGLEGFRQALSACAAGDWKKAASEFRDSRWWRNHLTHNRAEQIATMIQTGKWPS